MNVDVIDSVSGWCVSMDYVGYVVSIDIDEFEEGNVYAWITTSGMLCSDENDG